MLTEEEVNARVAPYWAEIPVWRGVDVGPGWYDVVVRAVDYLTIANPEARILQIKEKFAGLRIYFSGSLTEEQRREFDQILAECDSLCERCGSVGELRTRGWHRILCDACEDARD